VTDPSKNEFQKTENRPTEDQGDLLGNELRAQGSYRTLNDWIWSGRIRLCSLARDGRTEDFEARPRPRKKRPGSKWLRATTWVSRAGLPLKGSATIVSDDGIEVETTSALPR